MAIEKIKEIVFCCLSTGIFGFPKEESAKVAVKSIRNWLSKEQYKFDSIIFDVFTYEDHMIYQKIF